MNFLNTFSTTEMTQNYIKAKKTFNSIVKSYECKLPQKWKSDEQTHLVVEKKFELINEKKRNLWRWGGKMKNEKKIK